jgi:hypothetical protein
MIVVFTYKTPYRWSIFCFVFYETPYHPNPRRLQYYASKVCLTIANTFTATLGPLWKDSARPPYWSGRQLTLYAEQKQAP